MPEELQIDAEDTVKPLPPGTLVAERYRIVETVGHGGMGVVYKAEHIHIGRTVALKMLLSDGHNSNVNFRRFKQEAQAASILEHPNIVRIHDFGLTSDNLAYLAMDFLEGTSCSDVFFESAPLPLERFKKIFLQACDALQHAHSKGAIHRDIKPSNLVLIERNGEKDVLIVVDFGLVKLLEQPNEQKLTKTNAVVGSPLYMSPEQCRAVELDHRSDIYSLGCAMYQALTGCYALIGETVMDTMMKHISVPPIPVREARPDIYIPASLERVVMQTLAKNPADRPQSMEELGKSLLKALSGAPDSVPVPVVSILAPAASDPATSSARTPSLKHDSRNTHSSVKKSNSTHKSKSGINGGAGKKDRVWASAGPWIGVAAILSLGILIGAIVNAPVFKNAAEKTRHVPGAGQTTAPDMVAVQTNDTNAGTTSANPPTALPAKTGANGYTQRTTSSIPTLPSTKPGLMSASTANIAGADTHSLATSTPVAATFNPVNQQQQPTMDSGAPPTTWSPFAGNSNNADPPSEQLLIDGIKANTLHNWQAVKSNLEKWLAFQQQSGTLQANPATAKVYALLVIATFQLNDREASATYLNQFGEALNRNSNAMADENELMTQVALISRSPEMQVDTSFSERILKSAIESYSQKHRTPDRKFIGMQMELSRMYADEHKPEESIKILKQCLEQSQQYSDVNSNVRSKLMEMMAAGRPPMLPSGAFPGMEGSGPPEGFPPPQSHFGKLGRGAFGGPPMPPEMQQE